MSLKYLTCPSKILDASITASSVSFRLNNIKGWNGIDLTAADFGSQAFAVIRNANNTVLELIEFDPATIANSSITILKRGLKFTGDLTTEVTANKLPWTKGDTFIDIGVDTPQMLQWLQEYIDAAIVAGGIPSTTAVLGLVKMSVAPSDPANPTAVGTNDPRVPSTSGAAFIAATTGMIAMYGAAAAPTGFLLCNGAAVSRATYAALFAIIGTGYGVGDGATTFNVPNLQSRFPLGYAASAPTKIMTFASRSSNVITVTGVNNHANNELQTGQLVRYSTSGTVITGLTNNTDYYVIRISATTFSLATTRALAINGTAIALSSDGTGTQTFTLTYTARPIAETGGEETHSLTVAEIPAHRHENNIDNSAGGTESITGSGDSGVFEANDTRTNFTGGSTAHNIMPLFTVVNYIIKT